MSSLTEHIKAVQALGFAEGSRESETCERLLIALLDAEGPPAEPIPGFSTNLVQGLARSPKGRPLYPCASWMTGGWTCLLLDLTPVSMGRPIFLPNPSGKGPPRAVTDYQSQKFQKRVGAACESLNLPALTNPSRLTIRLSGYRTFLAWAPMPAEDAPALRGDLDNFTKNTLDGLQRSGRLKNDRDIARLHVTREHLAPPTHSIDDLLLERLAVARAENPQLGQRALAKIVGMSQLNIRRLLRLLPAAAPKPGRKTAGKPKGNRNPSAPPKKGRK